MNTIGYGRARFEVPLHEAAREAPFQMFVPERVPSEYQLRLTNVPGRDRPPLPAAVMLWYRTEDAAAALTISETTPDTPGVLDRIGTGAAPVEEIEHRGGRTRVRGATAKWRQTQLAFVRDRTAIAISSTEFDADSLVELASRLVPAPTTVQSREVSFALRRSDSRTPRMQGPRVRVWASAGGTASWGLDQRDSPSGPGPGSRSPRS